MSALDESGLRSFDSELPLWSRGRRHGARLGALEGPHVGDHRPAVGGRLSLSA
jgi:hypothetical protein